MQLMFSIDLQETRNQKRKMCKPWWRQSNLDAIKTHSTNRIEKAFHKIIKTLESS